MEEEYFNQRINCNVSHCKYFDHSNEKCTLGSIKVSESNTRETCCGSYQKNELE